MNYLTPAQWVVLDNMIHGWTPRTNLDYGMADEAYIWLVNNEYIKDGRLTALGETATLTHRIKKTSGEKHGNI